MGTASRERLADRLPRVATITTVNDTTLAVTEWNTHDPPERPSTMSGNNAPRVSHL